MTSEGILKKFSMLHGGRGKVVSLNSDFSWTKRSIFVNFLKTFTCNISWVCQFKEIIEFRDLKDRKNEN